MMANYPDVQWHIYEAAIFTVRKPGGLGPGLHDVEVSYGNSSSYTPYPANGWAETRTYKKRMSLVR